jgi:DNA-binding CsgD family transcriptional regulator
VFLVDERGKLVHVNAAGEAMLGAKNALQLVEGVLAAAEAETNRSLHGALAAVSKGDAAMKGSGIALQLKGHGGNRFVAHVLPLTAGARREAGVTWSAAAALFVCQANVDLPSAIDAAAQLFRLTPAEVRVLRALIEVGGIAPVAELLGTSQSTVKKHLEHIFEKTGTRRQTDLFKLIAGFDSPARHHGKKA